MNNDNSSARNDDFSTSAYLNMEKDMSNLIDDTNKDEVNRLKIMLVLVSIFF
jgi:hypothetical protein